MLQAHHLDALEQALNQAFSEYDSSSQLLFNYLKELSAKKEFNRKQFEIYRDNFFFRTSSTPRSILRLVIAAMRNFDLATFRTATANFLDEWGQAGLKNSHAKLLETAYNFHGKKVFSLPAVAIADVQHSSFICPEAIKFRKIQKSLYENRSYLIVLGCSFAQEFAADGMLRIFYTTLFEPYKSRYTEQEFGHVSRYFAAHINGLEAHHAEHAKQALMRHCHTEKDVGLIMQGVVGFLQIQVALWNGILREMQKAGESG